MTETLLFFIVTLVLTLMVERAVSTLPLNDEVGYVLRALIWLAGTVLIARYAHII